MSFLNTLAMPESCTTAHFLLKDTSAGKPLADSAAAAPTAGRSPPSPPSPTPAAVCCLQRLRLPCSMKVIEGQLSDKTTLLTPDPGVGFPSPAQLLTPPAFDNWHYDAVELENDDKQILTLQNSWLNKHPSTKPSKVEPRQQTPFTACFVRSSPRAAGRSRACRSDPADEGSLVPSGEQLLL